MAASNVLVARKVTEATQMMIDLTGLSAEQFRQVMVLPQGKFRELLLAPSEAREKIFQQLFQTQVYSRLENLLRERANALSSEVARLRERQGGMLLSTGAETAEALAKRGGATGRSAGGCRDRAHADRAAAQRGAAGTGSRPASRTKHSRSARRRGPRWHGSKPS